MLKRWRSKRISRGKRGNAGEWRRNERKKSKPVRRTCGCTIWHASVMKRKIVRI